jgi:threonine/homoserine/homoserine lactone efflux protein
MGNPADFFTWLAVQPAFLEVGLGAFFCLIVAPAVLAAIAITVTALEALAERQLNLLLDSRRTSSLNPILRAPAQSLGP